MNWQIHWSVAKIKREKVPETLEHLWRSSHKLFRRDGREHKMCKKYKLDGTNQ